MACTSSSIAKYSSGVSGGLPNFFRDAFFRWSASRSYIVVEVEVVYPIPSSEEEEDDDIDAAESLGLENNDDTY